MESEQFKRQPEYNNDDVDADGDEDIGADTTTTTGIVSAAASTQSSKLSMRQKQRSSTGKTLIDDSSKSEKTLNTAMKMVISYATALFSAIGYSIVHEQSITLGKCKQIQQQNDPDFAYAAADSTISCDDDERFSMRPDGGILYAVYDADPRRRIPILVTEDKVQGTNDQLYAENKKRQSCGNAIERGCKNIRAAEMLFSYTDFPIFPYVLFASGCDFHPSETISKRIDMGMTYGRSPHIIVLTPCITPAEITSCLDQIVSKIDIKISPRRGKCIPTIVIKTHKYDEMEHGSSAWSVDEITRICCKVIDDVFKTFPPS
jgi:hypothetical protein